MSPENPCHLTRSTMMELMYTLFLKSDVMDVEDKANELRGFCRRVCEETVRFLQARPLDISTSQETTHIAQYRDLEISVKILHWYMVHDTAADLVVLQALLEPIFTSTMADEAQLALLQEIQVSLESGLKRYEESCTVEKP